ncbi:hypothetical protein CANCADRAFT_72940 [Tortispora caseinolytica NRRL Y-17796]|uniref:Uncharacterized protein n=1 Tax=Tortispora caseinolytica NRRL Y-17796 TaxID=767744 RepID=A0A1E4TIL3_9ASCO|nr:hypothetical protein CANCADRAFT_72940 [Tortispora caseinolytica NRRL Y-17796]
MVLRGGPQPVWKKYTTPSKGIWEKIRQWLAIAPNRSSGNPYVPYNRDPQPFSRPESKVYRDPLTIPSGDIADNPYWKRDVRRDYPKLSFVDQKTVSTLLTVGSAQNPRLPVGAAGEKALTLATSSTEPLSNVLSKLDASIISGEILGKDGLPPKPVSQTENKLRILTFEEGATYPPNYPVRSFQ